MPVPLVHFSTNVSLPLFCSVCLEESRASCTRQRWVQPTPALLLR